MNRRLLTRSLLTGVGLSLGLLLIRPVPRATAQEPSTPVPGTLTLVAGTGQPGFSGDEGPATQARLNGLGGLAVDVQGNLFVADTGNHRVRRVGTDGTITTIAGTGTSGSSGDRGPAREARLNRPASLAFDPAGNLFIAESDGGRVRRVSPDGTITTVPAGLLVAPHGLAVDLSGNLFIADPGREQVRKLSPDGTTARVAGTGTPGFSGDGGAAPRAELSRPQGLAVDAVGNLYIADSGNDRVRRVGVNGTITTVARVSSPSAVAVDSAGTLFVTEGPSHRVWKVNSDGSLTAVAGGGASDPSIDGEPATAVGLKSLTGLALDGAGNLFVAESSRLDAGGRDRIYGIWKTAAPGLIGARPFPPSGKRWLKVAAVTMNAKPNTAANLGTMVSYMEQAARNGVDLLVFPELALQGCPGWREESVRPSAAELAYSQQTAETIPGPGTDALVLKAKELKLYVVFGMMEKDEAGRLYNAAVYLGPEGVFGRHRKVAAVGNDSLIWMRSRGFEPVDGPLGKIGLFICADMSAAPGRSLASRGADLLVSTSAWWTSVGGLWDAATIRESVASGRWHVASNQVGRVGYAVCYGHSRVIDPAGRVVCDTGVREGLVIWSTDVTLDARSAQ